MTPMMVGLDVSKGYADVAVISVAGDQLHTGRYDDTAAGHAALTEALNAVVAEVSPPITIRIGMESSGGYERNWARWARMLAQQMAHRATVTVFVLNPLAVKRFLSRELHRTTTDRSSARGIAQYLAGGMRTADVPYEPEMEGPLSLYRWIVALVGRAASQKVELSAVLSRAQPELVRYCREGIPQWILQVLERYPTAVQLSRARATTLAQIAYLTPSRAERIIRAAKTSVASLTDEYTQMAVSGMASELRQARARIAALKHQLIDLMADDPVVRLLDSIPGIGTWSAICLRLEIGRIDRFYAACALVSYTGLDPVVVQSGDTTHHRGISKRGKSRLRAILYLCAMSAKQCNPVIRPMTERLASRGKPPIVCVVAAMRKLVELIYACWITGVPFDPARWQAHLTRVRQAQEHETKSSNQALTDPGSTAVTSSHLPDALSAPISRREAQRRKATSMPQGSVRRQVRGPGAASRSA